MSNFTLATAEQLLNDAQVNEFPVDFDAAWEWLEYYDKSTARRAFDSCGFEAGVDFEVLGRSAENPRGGRPAVVIKMTIDCFKNWCMMSGTSKGKEVRRYFIECERKLKQLTQPKDSLELIIAQAESIAMLARAANEQRLMMQKHRELLEAHDGKLEATNERIANVEMHTTGHEDYFCLKAFVNLHKIKMDRRTWSALGKEMTRVSKLWGYDVKLVPHATYGRVNAYHVDALKRYFVGEC